MTTTEAPLQVIPEPITRSPKENPSFSSKFLFYLSRCLLCVTVVAILFRTLLFDLIWLLPRQPVTGGLLAVVFPRFITLYCPGWIYNVLSVFFDGDGTPLLLLAAYGIIFSSGIKIQHYFTNMYDMLQGRKRKLCLMTFVVFVLFFFSPISWFARLIAAEINHYNLVVEHGLRSRLFNIVDHVFNTFYHPQTLTPDLTMVYKTVPLEAVQNQTCFDPKFFLPGDAPQPDSEAFKNLYESGQLELDVYIPDKYKGDFEGKKPGIVMHIHGGGWDKGHRHFLKMNYHGGVPKTILESHIIVSVSYRLSCTGIDGSEMLEDILDATKFIVENAERWGANPQKIVPWGTSAGGTLALLLAYKHNGELPIRGVINFYGVTELREEKVFELVQSPYEKFHSNIFVEMTRHICETNDRRHETKEHLDKCFEEFSPAAHVTENAPPTLTIHGEQDGLVLVNQAFHLQDILRRNNVQGSITIAVQGVHDCDVFSSSLCGQAAVKAVDKFLQKVFK